MTYLRSKVRVSRPSGETKKKTVTREIWVYHAQREDLTETGRFAPKIRLPRKRWRVEEILETQLAKAPQIGDILPA